MNERRPEINVPQINVLCWDDLSDEDKNHYIDFPNHNKWDYDADPLKDSVVVMHQQSVDELVKMTEQVFKDCCPHTYSTFPPPRIIDALNIILHKSVADQLGVKKKIESILSLKCFW